MKLLKSIVFVLSFVICYLSFAQSAFALDVLPYFLGSNSTGTNISSGEFFKTTTSGTDTFTINKSKDSGYYEQYKYDGSFIYQTKDTTWATEDGNVECSNGDEAVLTYGGGSAKWIPKSMEVGKSFDSSITVQGISASTGKPCDTEFNGTVPRSITLEYQGCVAFPNGVASPNAVELNITAGPGAGEHFFFDAQKGFIGFNRGENETGAYATDVLGGEGETGCKQITATVGNKSRCPAGYTCPNTSPRLLDSEIINLQTNVTKRDGVPKGKTGPVENKLQIPNLDQENEFFSTTEFFLRALPASVIEKLNFDPQKMFETQNFTGQVTHSGCGDVFLDGQNLGKNELETKPPTNFNTKSAYDKQLLVSRFWQAIFVPGKPANTKFKAMPQNKDNYPVAPGSSGDCANDTSAEVDKTDNANSAPPELSLFGGIAAAVGNFLSGLTCTLIETVSFGQEESCKSVPLKLTVQEKKIIPGEVAFDNQTVGPLGFLQYYKQASVDFPKDKAQRDESDKSDWLVLGKNVRDVGNSDGTGMTNEGIAAFQTGTCDMINSLYPASERPCNGTLSTASIDSPILPPSIGLDFTIPFRDINIRVSDSRKTKIIGELFASYSNTHTAEQWDNVVNTAIANGINPAFAIAIWYEETGGGGVGQSDFGCFDGGNTDLRMTFDDSLRCFINFTAHEHGNDFEDWVKNFCGPKAVPICSNNPNFLGRLKTYYAEVTTP